MTTMSSPPTGDRGRVGVGVLLAIFSATCSNASNESAGEPVAYGTAEIRPIERTIVGAAAPYEADSSLRARTSALAASQKARRKAAWGALARVLRPVAIAEKAPPEPSVPTFRTWYGSDDFQRIFAHAFSSMSAADRTARRALRDDEIAAALAWNATSRGSASDDDYAARLGLLNDRAAVNGLGGNMRVSYSPAAIAHLAADYAHALDCTRARSDDPEPSPTSFAPCLGEEMPTDAAIVKTAWLRADFGATVPAYDTSPRRQTPSDGSWGPGENQASPGPSDIYTIRLNDGTSYRLAGMHLMTKELREWLWITIFWSPDPNADLGADRPDAIRALDGPWSHYAMCVVTSYDERDPDPRGGYDGSLGDALAAAYGGVGGPTWCSNPYIEHGAHNAQTNCIGCHQHAATDTRTETILSDVTRFPANGRTRSRRSFLSDYVWSIGPSPEHLATIIDTARARFFFRKPVSP